MAKKYNIAIGYSYLLEEITSLLKFIERFNQLNNEINLLPHPIEKTDEELIKEISILPIDNIAIDLIILNSENIPYLANIGKIHTIESADEYDYYTELVKMVKYQDKIFGLPLIESNPYALFYNQSIFYNSKIEEVPTNWIELETCARNITKDNDNDGLIDRWGYIPEKKDFILFLLQNDCEILNDNNQPVFNTKEGYEALNFLLTLSNRFSPPHKDFTRGDCGMIIAKVQYMKKLKDIDFRISSLPAGKKKMNLFADMRGVKCLAIINKTKEKIELSEQFINWFSDTMNYTEWCILNNYIPIKKSVMKIDKYHKYLSENEFINIFIEELKYCKGIPSIVQLPQIREILDNMLEILNFKETIKEPELKAIVDKAVEDIHRII